MYGALFILNLKVNFKIYNNFWIFSNLIFIEDEDSAALFLCKHWVCTSEEFNQAIISIWKNWEEEGFPIGLPRNVLSERYLKF